MTESLDIEHLRSWIGAEERVEDLLDPGLAARFHLTLDMPGDPAGEGDAAPRLLHFCLCQPIAATAMLGADGHPARGGFLPPVPLPRRMWAASRIAFIGDLRVGERVRRDSRISDVTVKEGRTGTLCFVTVDHRISGSSGVVVEEQQTIVYRGAEDGSMPPAAATAEAAPEGMVKQTVDPSPPLLFRYSALTFNGHRIHYDRPYATDIEGYPGLVVHGPLQATLLLHFAARQRDGRAPDRFTFRSGSPLYDLQPVELHCEASGDGGLSLWTARPGGPFAMRADAAWN
ncbi:MaoC family dehydratase N-terminal domain-containing protein [Sphingobium sp. Sx8-8]|uniref:FAS1-like dehydratase domain-containing protein n=1 Tax=Sphingobium sp. Sx8-8 TaxID=2933617 RepID=UPI001F565E98|nr:MaoC family dehydratase N-terminal domain-containing protein [Sphingobium sp. Sx8-8]